MSDIKAEFTAYRDDIQRILNKHAPKAKVPDADARAILAILDKIGKLGDRMRASAQAAREPEPEQADPLAAGAKLDALAKAAIKASGGKLSYSEAFAGLVMEHWPLVQEWQQSVQPPRRRR